MSNINELVLYEYVSWGQDDSLVNGINNGIKATGRGLWNYGVKAPANFAWNYGVKPAGNLAWGVTKPILKGAAYTAAGAYGAGLLGKAIANTDVGAAAIGGIAGAGARGLGGLALNYGGNALVNSGLTGLASAIPFAGSIAGAGIGAYQQHRINQLNDEYDQMRGITPTSSPLINGIKTLASGALGAIPFGGAITNAIQGSRLALAERRNKELSDQQAYNNTRYGATAPTV